jgi:hypothetical protein
MSILHSTFQSVTLVALIWLVAAARGDTQSQGKPSDPITAVLDAFKRAQGFLE